MEKELEKKLDGIDSKLKELVQTVCVDALGRLKILQQEIYIFIFPKLFY